MNDQTTLPARARREIAVPALFGRLRDEIDTLFDDFAGTQTGRNLFSWPAAARFTPPMEFVDRKDHYELSVEVPGMEDKDINVETADGMLVISGEKSENREEESGGYLLSERIYGSFRRELSLPSDVDADAIEAQYRRGVLKLTLKKDAKAADRVRKIAIG